MSAIDQILKLIRGSSSSEGADIMQALMGEMQMASSITSRITNKRVSDVIDDVFSLKRRHKVTHV